MISIPEDIYKQASFAEGDEARDLLWEMLRRVCGFLGLLVPSLSIFVSTTPNYLIITHNKWNCIFYILLAQFL